MPGSSERSALSIRTADERTELWRRIGRFVRQRREELGLTQGDIIRVLGYKSRNAVSNIEIGVEGLPTKRAYAWADLLEVSRDAFFEFVTGQRKRLDAKAVTGTATTSAHGGRARAVRLLPAVATELSTAAARARG